MFTASCSWCNRRHAHLATKQPGAVHLAPDSRPGITSGAAEAVAGQHRRPQAATPHPATQGKGERTIAASGPFRGRKQPEVKRMRQGEAAAPSRNIKGMLADVFGEDSSNSGGLGDAKQHDAVTLEMPEDAPDKEPVVLINGKATYRSDQGVGHEPQEVQHPRSRQRKGKITRQSQEAAPVSTAKRKADTAEQPARTLRAAARAAKPAAAVKPAREFKRAKIAKRKQGGSKLVVKKPRPQAGSPSRDRGNDGDQVKHAAVDWKAYADALDVKMAEAEALLAEDSV